MTSGISLRLLGVVVAIAWLTSACSPDEVTPEVPDQMPRVTFLEVPTTVVDGRIAVDLADLASVKTVTVVQGSPPTPNGDVYWKIESIEDPGTPVTELLIIGEVPEGFSEAIDLELPIAPNSGEITILVVDGDGVGHVAGADVSTTTPSTDPPSTDEHEPTSTTAP